MENKTLSQIKNEIESIRAQLLDIDDMRPGSLTKQYRNPKEQTGQFFQISYTHQMKSRTEYVRPQFVQQVRRQIRNYKIFKKLVDRWVALGIQYSQLSMKADIERSQQRQRKKTKRRQRK
jgi:hypothetical protein